MINTIHSSPAVTSNTLEEAVKCFTDAGCTRLSTTILWKTDTTVSYRTTKSPGCSV